MLPLALLSCPALLPVPKGELLSPKEAPEEEEEEEEEEDAPEELKLPRVLVRKDTT